MKKNTFLSTGQLAEMYAVTPDCVLKWIKDGKISAIRTPGGHFRIPVEDVIKVNEIQNLENRDQFAPYCWQYNAKDEVVRKECKACIVYKARAKRCYQLSNLPQEMGYAGQFCDTECNDCDYYKNWGQVPG